MQISGDIIDTSTQAEDTYFQSGNAFWLVQAKNGRRLEKLRKYDVEIEKESINQKEGVMWVMVLELPKSKQIT